MANNDRVSELYRGEIFDAETTEKCRRRIHWLCQHSSGSRILEIGCSQGVTTILLAREGYEVVGIDVEDDALEYARRELASEPPSVIERVSFESQDARATQFPDAVFDTVILGEVLEHLTQPSLLLAEAQRVLKPGGVVLVTTPLGILPHPDHKQTFMVGSFLDLVGPYFQKPEIELVDKTIFYRAIKAEDGAKNGGSDWKRSAAGLLGQLEEQFLLRDGEVARLNRTCEETFGANRDLRQRIAKLAESVEKLSSDKAIQVTKLRQLREDAESTSASLVEARAELQRSANAAGTIGGLRERCRDQVEELRALREEMAESASGHQMALSVARKDQEKLEGELRVSAHEAGAVVDLRVRCERMGEELSAARETFDLEIRDLIGQVAGAAEVRLRNTALESDLEAAREHDNEHRRQLRVDAARLAQLEEQTRNLVSENAELRAAREAVALEARSAKSELAEQVARTAELGSALEETTRREVSIQAEISKLTGLSEAAALRAQSQEQSQEARNEQQLAQIEKSGSELAALQDELRRLAFEAGAVKELRTRGDELAEQRRVLSAQVAEQTNLLQAGRERAEELEGALHDTRQEHQTLSQQKLRLEDVLRDAEHTSNKLSLDNAQARQDTERSLARVAELEQGLIVARTEIDRQTAERSAARAESELAAEAHAKLVAQVDRLRAEADQVPRMRDELASLSERVTSEGERASGVEVLYLQEQSKRAEASELAVVRGAEVERLQARAARLEERVTSLTSQFESEQAARSRLNASLRRYTSLAERRQAELADIRSSGAFRLAYRLSLALRPFGAQRIMRSLRARSDRRASEASQVEDRSDSQTAVSAVQAEAKQTGTATVGRAATTSGAPSQTRRKLRVAGILDEFSRACFAPDCDLSTFRPDNWQAVLESSPPEMLLVESAWHGNEDAWIYRIASYQKKFGDELQDMIAWCRERSIPTVFWNKEDPVHYDRFIESAARFDVVLTSDANCVERYRAALGHDRVHSLPFAAQPLIHNPLSTEPRLAKTCFAGTYYRGRHSQRRVDMELVLEPALERGLDIYDRTFGTVGSGAAEYGFPEVYQSSVRGRLEYEEVVQAYKKYLVFLNVNSVTDSPTMFSRRVFELLACGTPVVSSYALGIEKVLGEDLVRMSRSIEETRAHLDALFGDPETWSRSSAAGLCRVLAGHTYAHRLSSLASIVGLEEQGPARDTVAAIVRVASDDELPALERFATQQTRTPDEILVVRTGKVSDRRLRALRRKFGSIPLDSAAASDVGEIERWRARSKSTHVALIRAADFYGQTYLEESLLAFTYAPTPFVGRTAHYRWDGRGAQLEDGEKEHSIAEQAPWGSLLGLREAVTEELVHAAESELAVSVPGSVCGFHCYNYLQGVQGGQGVPALASGSPLASVVLDWKRPID